MSPDEALPADGEHVLSSLGLTAGGAELASFDEVGVGAVVLLGAFAATVAVDGICAESEGC